MVEIDQLDFSDLEKQFSIKEEDVFGGCVIIDNLPIVDESKKTKLVDFVTKIIKKWGKVKADGLHMPLADNGKTKGY